MMSTMTMTMMYGCEYLGTVEFSCCLSHGSRSLVDKTTPDLNVSHLSRRQATVLAVHWAQTAVELHA